MNEKYINIIKLPHHTSDRHPKMPNCDRAAQFAPYAALVGYEACVKEEARLTEKKTELDEYEIERLDRRIRLAAEHIGEVQVSVTYFVKDRKKSGGAYVTKHAALLRVDTYDKIIVMGDGAVIPIYDIIEFEVENI